jgi:hypothetical protein
MTIRAGGNMCVLNVEESCSPLMYYLKHEYECFIRYKMRGAAERFISDKTRQRVKIRVQKNTN